MKFYLVVGLCFLSHVVYSEGKLKSVDLETLIQPFSTDPNFEFKNLVKPPNSEKNCECASWYTRFFTGLCKKNLIAGHTYESLTTLTGVTIKHNVVTYETAAPNSPKDSLNISLLRESNHNCNVWRPIKETINLKTEMGETYKSGKIRFGFFANQNDKILNENHVFIVMDSDDSSISAKLWKFNWDPQTDILYCMNIVIKENVDCAKDSTCKGFQLTDLPKIFDPTKMHPDL